MAALIHKKRQTYSSPDENRLFAQAREMAEEAIPGRKVIITDFKPTSLKNSDVYIFPCTLKEDEEAIGKTFGIGNGSFEVRSGDYKAFCFGPDALGDELNRLAKNLKIGQD